MGRNLNLDLDKLKPWKFEWDRFNKDKNWIKHKVDFKECEQIFFNKPVEFLFDKKHSQRENRIVALGITDQQKMLIVIFTIRKDKIRVISARNQSQKERRIYEQK